MTVGVFDLIVGLFFEQIVVVWKDADDGRNKLEEVLERNNSDEEHCLVDWYSRRVIVSVKYRFTSYVVGSMNYFYV